MPLRIAALIFVAVGFAPLSPAETTTPSARRRVALTVPHDQSAVTTSRSRPKHPPVPTGQMIGGTIYQGMGYEDGAGIEGFNTGRFTRVPPQYPIKGEPSWYPPLRIYATRDDGTHREGFVLTDAKGHPQDAFLSFGYRARASQLGGKGDAEYILVRAQNGGGYWVKTDPKINPLLSLAFPPGFFQRNPPTLTVEDTRYGWVNLETDARKNVAVDAEGQPKIVSASLFSASPATRQTTYWDPNALQAGRGYAAGQWVYNGRQWLFYGGQWANNRGTPSWTPYRPNPTQNYIPNYNYRPYIGPAYAGQPYNATQRGYSNQPYRGNSYNVTPPAAVCRTS